jgi:UDP-glucose 4-epimerase
MTARRMGTPFRSIWRRPTAGSVRPSVYADGPYESLSGTTVSLTKGGSQLRILVTGGAGFIGSHLVRALVERESEVTVLDDFSGSMRDRLKGSGRVRVIEGDVRDPRVVELAATGQEIVVHLAAVPSVTRSFRDPARTMSVNVDGTVNVMVAASAAGVRRVVLASSSSVYGPLARAVRRESDAPDPRSPYAASKLAAEHIVHSLGAAHGIQTVALRYFNVFGPSQDAASEYAAVIPAFVTALLRGIRPVVFGDGSVTRDFTYVENVVQATLLAVGPDVPTRSTFNVGSGRGLTVREVLGAIGEDIGVRASPIHAPARPGEARTSVADLQLAASGLGYVVGVPFREGLSRTVAWYREALADGVPRPVPA